MLYFLKIKFSLKTIWCNRIPTLKPQTITEMMERKMYEMKLRQRDLAKLLGVTENRLSEILNGKRKVNMDFAKRLHLRLNIDADFILKTA